MSGKYDDLKLKFIRLVEELLQGIERTGCSVKYEVDPEDEKPFETVAITISPSYAYIHKITLTFGAVFQFDGNGSLPVFRIDAYCSIGERYEYQKAISNDLQDSIYSAKEFLIKLVDELGRQHHQKGREIAELKGNYDRLDQVPATDNLRTF